MDSKTIALLMEHQFELAQKFSSIESKNLSGMNHSIPADLDSYEGQAVIRLFLTYFAEELHEAYEAEGAQRVEEFADALHFAVELCLRVGIVPDPENRGVHPRLTECTGLILRRLRNKPWKQTKAQTATHMIKHHTEQLFWAFLDHSGRYGIPLTKLLESYFAKAKVNHQRISSGY